MGGANHLFRNTGRPGKVPQFVDVTEKAGVAEPRMSFTTWFSTSPEILPPMSGMLTFAVAITR